MKRLLILISFMVLLLSNSCHKNEATEPILKVNQSYNPYDEWVTKATSLQVQPKRYGIWVSGNKDTVYYTQMHILHVHPDGQFYAYNANICDTNRYKYTRKIVMSAFYTRSGSIYLNRGDHNNAMKRITGN